MGDSALVVGSQAVVLFLFVLVAASWSGWFLRQWRTILSIPIGLLAAGFAVLAAFVAWESAYYGAARIGKGFGLFDLWRDGIAPYLISSLRVLSIGGAFVLALIARWRIDEMPVKAIRTRLVTLSIGCSIIGGFVSVSLW